MKKFTQSFALVLALCLVTMVALTGCGASKADKEFVDWTNNGDGKALIDAKAEYDAWANAGGVKPPDEAIPIVTKVIDASNTALASMQAIDRDKLNKTNQATYDSNIENIKKDLAVYEGVLAQCNAAVGEGGGEQPADAGAEEGGDEGGYDEGGYEEEE